MSKSKSKSNVKQVLDAILRRRDDLESKMGSCKSPARVKIFISEYDSILQNAKDSGEIDGGLIARRERELHRAMLSDCPDGWMDTSFMHPMDWVCLVLIIVLLIWIVMLIVKLWNQPMLPPTDTRYRRFEQYRKRCWMWLIIAVLLLIVVYMAWMFY